MWAPSLPLLTLGPAFLYARSPLHRTRLRGSCQSLSLLSLSRCPAFSGYGIRRHCSRQVEGEGKGGDRSRF